MSFKAKAILTVLAAAAATITWMVYKKAIIAFLTTAGLTALVVLGLYVAGRYWWWRRKRRRGAS